RVDMLVVFQNFKMKVRRHSSARHANGTDYTTLGNDLPLLHVDFVQVVVTSFVTIAMVDFNYISVAHLQIAEVDQANRSGSTCINRCTTRSHKVDTLMKICGAMEWMNA